MKLVECSRIGMRMMELILYSTLKDASRRHTQMELHQVNFAVEYWDNVFEKACPRLNVIARQTYYVTEKSSSRVSLTHGLVRCNVALPCGGALKSTLPCTDCTRIPMGTNGRTNKASIISSVKNKCVVPSQGSCCLKLRCIVYYYYQSYGLIFYNARDWQN